MPVLVKWWKGLAEIVGEHDTGKTIAALQTVYPYKKTIFIDDDVKGDATVKQFEEMEDKKRDDIFEKYYDLRKWRAKVMKGKIPATPTALLENVIDPIVEEICSKKHEVIIFDTGRILYQAARGHVERNQQLYGGVVKWQGKSEIIQGLISKVARSIEQSYLTRLKDNCELLIVTHHIKDWYKNNVVVGVIPESSSTYSEISTMRIWLRRNPQSKVPLMLFLKRPNIPNIVKGKPRFVNVVPPKITPTAKEQSIWDAIQRYVEDPVESRALRPDEQPSKEEMALISGTLSDDQTLYMMEVLKHQVKEKETVSTIIGAATGKGVDEVASIGKLLMKAMKDYSMDLMQVAEVLEIEQDGVMELSGEEVENAWETIKAFAKESGIG